MNKEDFSIKVHPMKTPYGWAIDVHAPDGERFAWTIAADTQEEGITWANNQIKAYIQRAVENCLRCGEAITLEQHGFCEKCQDDMQDEYLEDASEENWVATIRRV